jgi:hypothetical protein
MVVSMEGHFPSLGDHHHMAAETITLHQGESGVAARQQGRGAEREGNGSRGGGGGITHRALRSVAIGAGTLRP